MSTSMQVQKLIADGDPQVHGPKVYYIPMFSLKHILRLYFWESIEEKKKCSSSEIPG